MADAPFVAHMKVAREAGAAHRAFLRLLQEFEALGIAFKQDPTLLSVWNAKHAQLVAAETRAVEAHVAAYCGPTQDAMLIKACELAGVEGPVLADPQEDKVWLDDVMATVTGDSEWREMLRGLLFHAIRFARAGRLFSAAYVLERFDGLRSLP